MNLIDHTLFSCATHRGLTMQTLGSLQACNFGAVSLSQGITDVALARCVQFGMAWEAAKKLDLPFVLFVDDDMVFSCEQATQLLAEVNVTDCPTSARYVVGDLLSPKLAFSPLHAVDDSSPARYLTGLGFLAMSTTKLAALIEASEEVAWGARKIRAVTSSGPEHGQWYSEDYRICRRLGGVHLSSVEVGHVKSSVLYPAYFPDLAGG